ncbi:hypothetical protein HO133_009678 [Letharia lupina]|uniref:BTB domain-containing protein n=1 Tax=Letharia lupina TaxID=560253 RepID=A0A8H6FF82_9LECA|nr:uncharacterized protein HO133_009678 [Letharia lupina]KAF6225678.1 hypothetical protein HO133_009678 [Letharia lupina]
MGTTRVTNWSYGVDFDDGITVLQWNKKTEGTCKVKPIVESPPTIIQDKSTAQSQWRLEAKCVEIKEPEFDSKSNGDNAPGIENAKTFALASLNKEIEVVKIGGLTKSNFNKKSLGDEELRQQMIRLAAGKARGSPAMDAGVMVIDKDGDVTVEVIEYDDQIRDGNGNRPVTRNLQFRVCREVLTKNSSTFAAMFRPSHWTEAQTDLVKLEEDSVAGMAIWFRILHDTDLVYDVPLEEMWRLVTACDKYHLNLSMLKPWFADWYQKQNIDQYYNNWTIKGRHNTDLLDPRSLLYPCWIFDHAEGFMRATHFLSYNSVGHITEHNPTIHRDLRVESRVIPYKNSSTPRKDGFEQSFTTSFSVQMKDCSRHAASAKR